MSSHPIVHIELSTSNHKESAEFYSKIFGWDTQFDQQMNYTMWGTGEGQLGGGFNSVSDESPAGTVVIYIGTDDIEASLAKIEANGGGTVLPKTEIPGMGWFALFSDPSGNTVGLFTGMGQ